MIPFEKLQLIAKSTEIQACGSTQKLVLATLTNHDDLVISLTDYFDSNWSFIEYMFYESKFTLLQFKTPFGRLIRFAPKIVGSDEWMRPKVDILVDDEKFYALIDEILTKRGYIGLDLDYTFNCDCFPDGIRPEPYHCLYDHAFVICRTEKGEMIIDSYVDHRGLEIRSSDYQEAIRKMMTNPTTALWNQLFNGNLDDPCQRKWNSALYLKISL